MERNDAELKNLRKENMKLLERIRLLEKDIEHLKQVNQRLLKRKKWYGAMDKMEKQLNKISTAEMKKNMSEDTMTICECCEILETMIGDDKNILDCINYIEKKAKSMHNKLVQNKDEIKLLKFVKGTPMLLSETAEQLFKELGFRKNQSVCYDDKNIKYEKESSNGCDILTVHFYNGTFVYTENMNRAMVTDGKMLKAIYRQMMELGCI